MSAPYPGERGQKSRARAVALAHVCEWWLKAGGPDSRVLCVAGACGDVRPLRDGLGIAAHRVIACDRDPEAVAAWDSLWPECPAICGELSDVIAGIPDCGVTLAVLDLCGQIEEARPLIVQLSNKIPLHGALVLTVARGREHELWQRRARHTVADEKRIADEMGFTKWGHLASCFGAMDERGQHNRRVIGDALDAGRTRPGWRRLPIVDVCRLRLLYQSTSPMDIYVVVRTRMDDLRTTTTTIQARIRRQSARDAALAFADASHGLPSHIAEAFLNLTPGSLAAWKAHRTRGTYAEVRP